MELRVECADGSSLPQDCYIGVRVGEVLKQGRYEPQRSYLFPGIERRRNAKIDVYKHVGSCVVAVDPDTKCVHEVNVINTDPSEAPVRLKVNVVAKGDVVGKQREQRTKVVKNQAKEYLSKHSVEERLSEAVKALLKEQPANPTEFLCRHLMGQTTDGPCDIKKPVAPSKVEASRAGAEQGSQVGASPCKPPNAAPHASEVRSGAQHIQERQHIPSSPDPESIRKMARDCLVQAGVSGELNTVLAELRKEREEQTSREPKLTPFREYYRATMKALPEDDMMDIYAKFPLRKPPPARAVDKKPASGGKLKKGASDHIRKQACEILMEASLNGNLDSVLSEVRKGKGHGDDSPRRCRAKPCFLMPVNMRGSHVMLQAGMQAKTMII